MSNRTGSYFVVRTTGPMAALIRLVTRSTFNHAGVCLGDGLTVEAESRGAIIGDLDRYRDCEIAFSNYALTESESETIVRTALDMVGTPYGWADLSWLGLLQYGFRRSRFIAARVDRRDRLVCSQLVALVYLSEDIALSEDPLMPLDCTPGDLARDIRKGAP